MKPGKSGLTRLIDATAYSAKGIAACWRNEAAFRQEIVLFALALPNKEANSSTNAEPVVRPSLSKAMVNAPSWTMASRKPSAKTKTNSSNGE